MKKEIRYWLLVAVLPGILFLWFCFVGEYEPASEITWGVNFSQKHAENFGCDWREVYSVLLDDLGARHIKLASYWDLLEPRRDNFFFDDLDWQVQKSVESQAKIILVVGMKTPRWPECHLPDWAKNLTKEVQQGEILELLENLVRRYKDSPALKYWQVENEPFFPYGSCPWSDKEFLQREVALVQRLDTKHPVIIGDSGEGSLWLKAASVGDIVSTTLYRRVWVRQVGRYFNYPFAPAFYGRRAQIIQSFFHKEVIGGELQAEPWGPKLIYDLTPEEQAKTMNCEQFEKVVNFARNTGLGEFYFWGFEWWYWLKESQQDACIWEMAKSLMEK